MIKIIFWFSLTMLFYTYIGYPLLLSILMRFKKKKPFNKKDITPKISIVISAYNEETSIAKKLDNVLSLDYPREKMEVIVVSDASSDRTDEVVKEFASRGVRLHRLEERSGKISAYRSVFPLLKGEIIVFSDATSQLSKDSIRQLIRNFNDPSVGCVGGLLVYVNPKSAIVGEGENKYWKYERKIKEYESSLCSLTSVSGTLYAVRKCLYPYGMKDDLADDLMVPFETKKKGFRVVLEENAVCKEFTTWSVKEEMVKRIRITIQNIRGLINNSEILNPFKYGLYSILVLSHKLLRLSVPFLLLMLLVSTSILAYSSSIYLVILISQIIFYIVGLAGYFINKKIKFEIANSVFYFCLSNLAILVGIIGFFRGRKVAMWEPIRANS